MTALLDEDLQSIIDGLSLRSAGLRGADILITGASGFFGMWLTEGLVALDRHLDLRLRLTLVARDGDRLRTRTKHLVGAPLEILVQDIRALQPGRHHTHVIHAAASASAALNETSPAEMLSVIVDGTRRVLDVTPDAHRLLFVSSGAVYGVQTEDLVDEACGGGPDITQARSAYAEGKRLAEVMCAIAGQETSRVISTARAFAFVGAWLPLDTHFAVGNFLRDAMAGGPIVVSGDGTAIRSYLHAADLVVWLLTILLEGRAGRAYNVGSDTPISIRDLATTVGSMMGASVEIRGTPTPGSAPHRYVPSVVRAREELGLRQTIGLEDALRRTVRWHGARCG